MNKKISLAVQKFNMEKDYPDWKCFIKRERLTCTGYRRPTDLSENYKLKITYSLNSSPRIEVIEPKLVENKIIPHTYNNKYPCVYLPNTQEWTPNKLIANTIILYATSWLYFYEVWLITGEWRGGGVHPQKVK